MGVQPVFLCLILIFGCVSPAPIKNFELHSREETEEYPQENTLVVKEGATQSVTLNIDVTKILGVSKYDPQTGQWIELLLAAQGSSDSLTDITSIRLVNQNFVVRNAMKADEGLYRIISDLDKTYLARIHVTVASDSTTPVPNISSTVTSKAPSPVPSNAAVTATGWTFCVVAAFVSAIMIQSVLY